MDQYADIAKTLVITLIENKSLVTTKAGVSSSEEINNFAVEQVNKAYTEIYKNLIKPQ